MATQPQLPTCRELDDHSFGPEDIASMSAAFEAALGQLGLIERNDLATMAIAKVIIGLAKEGERDPERLCVTGGQTRDLAKLANRRKAIRFAARFNAAMRRQSDLVD